MVPSGRCLTTRVLISAACCGLGRGQLPRDGSRVGGGLCRGRAGEPFDQLCGGGGQVPRSRPAAWPMRKSAASSRSTGSTPGSWSTASRQVATTTACSGVTVPAASAAWAAGWPASAGPGRPAPWRRGGRAGTGPAATVAGQRPAPVLHRPLVGLGDQLDAAGHQPGLGVLDLAQRGLDLVVRELPHRPQRSTGPGDAGPVLHYRTHVRRTADDALVRNPGSLCPQGFPMFSRGRPRAGTTAGRRATASRAPMQPGLGPGWSDLSPALAAPARLRQPALSGGPRGGGGAGAGCKRWLTFGPCCSPSTPRLPR